MIPLFVRDLHKLKEELAAHPNESTIWEAADGVTNSPGNLALHLIGNLNHFIGGVLGDSGYQRNRAGEFEDKNIPLDNLIAQIDEVIEMIPKVLENLSKEDFNQPYPIEVFGKPIQTDTFILHLYGHLNYHLGQINYHRRIQAKA